MLIPHVLRSLAVACLPWAALWVCDMTLPDAVSSERAGLVLAGVTTLVAWLLGPGRWPGQAMVWCVAMVASMVAAVFFGAAVFAAGVLGVCWAAILASLVALPIVDLTLDAWLLVSVSTWAEALPLLTAVCALVGSWLGAIPIPLDMDEPWQIWPIPCIYGAYIGYGAGVAIGALAYSYYAWFILDPADLKRK
jgi:phosphatidylinositol glycan class F